MFDGARRTVVVLVGVLVAVALEGCGETTQQRLARENRDAKAAQQHALTVLARAERRSAAAGLELMDQARARCQDARRQAGRSTPLEAHRLAVRFAAGFAASLQLRMVAVCARELAR